MYEFFSFAETQGFGHEFLVRFAHKNSRPRLADPKGPRLRPSNPHTSRNIQQTRS